MREIYIYTQFIIVSASRNLPFCSVWDKRGFSGLAGPAEKKAGHRFSTGDPPSITL